MTTLLRICEAFHVPVARYCRVLTTASIDVGKDQNPHLTDFGQASKRPLSRPLANPHLTSDLAPGVPLLAKRGNP